MYKLSNIPKNRLKTKKMKSIYRHKQTGKLFAIETDPSGSIHAVCGPLKANNLDPRVLDYDDYWNWQSPTHLADYNRLTRDDYRKLLEKNSFLPQFFE